MRALLLFGLGCLCTAVAAADRQTPAPILPQPVLPSAATPMSTPSAPGIAGATAKPTASTTGAAASTQLPRDDATAAVANPAAHTITADQLVSKIDTNFGTHPAGFKCELLLLNPKQISDAFGGKAWAALGKVEVSRTLWEQTVRAAVQGALIGPAPTQIFWYSPAVGLRAEIPNTTPTLDNYLLLMFFEKHSAKFYFNGHKISAPSTIYDKSPWRDIFTNAGISLTPATSSSK
jgi:hypothetical protein